MFLREMRFWRGFTQYEITKRAGIAQSRISLIENEYINPKEEEKEKLAQALECKVSDIFPENGELKNEIEAG